MQVKCTISLTPPVSALSFVKLTERIRVLGARQMESMKSTLDYRRQQKHGKTR